MATLRIVFATLVILLGVYYATLSVLALTMFHSMSTAAFPAVFVASFVLLLPIGVIAVCCGVGLLALRPWSRRLWLATSAFLVIFHLCWLAHDLRSDSQIVPLVPAITILLFCTASWFFLKSYAARRLFI